MAMITAVETNEKLSVDQNSSPNEKSLSPHFSQKSLANSRKVRIEKQIKFKVDQVSSLSVIINFCNVC